MDEEESLNKAIYEEVALVPYDPHWSLMFDVERVRLLALFPNEFISIEHFGSTAIPGLSAKPIIDILAGVESMLRADALIEPLCRSKYTTSPQFNASLTERRWLMRWADGRRTHHLHVVVYGGAEWGRRLAFRDALRANGELAEQYERKKTYWAAQFRSDREAYTAAKADFVQEVLENAT